MIIQRYPEESLIKELITPDGSGLTTLESIMVLMET
jgi:hypothetical protein